MNNNIYTNSFVEMLRNHFDDGNFKYVSYPKLIFLCGKAKDSDYPLSNRGKLERYLLNNSKDLRIVLSELIWQDSFSENIDLLTFEEFLAEVCDDTILFVESYGSACELGTFAYAEKLFGKKLTLFLDNQFKDAKSFIRTGPTEKAKVDGANVVFSSILDKSDTLTPEIQSVADIIVREAKFKQLPKNLKRTNKERDKIRLNIFVVELLELLHFVQPITSIDLLELYKMVKGFPSIQFKKTDGKEFHNRIEYSYIIRLLLQLELIKEKDGLLYVKEDEKIQNLMFDLNQRTRNKERNRLLCRKLKYGEYK